MLHGWVMYTDHATRVGMVLPARLPGWVWSSLLDYPGGFIPPVMLPWWVIPPVMLPWWVCTPWDHGGYVHPEDHGRCTSLGIHLSYYGGYTPPWVCTPLPHPGYTHHPPTPPPVCASAPALAEVPDDDALGSRREIPLGEEGIETLRTQRCED